jgi:hypothetical protein
MDFMHSMSSPDPRPDPLENGYHTDLGDREEQQFQEWVREHNIPFDDSIESKYDLRGHFTETGPDAESGRAATRGELPATYKTPYDRTMSKESIHAFDPNGNDAPHWEGNKLIRSGLFTTWPADPVCMHMVDLEKAKCKCPLRRGVTRTTSILVKW